MTSQTVSYEPFDETTKAFYHQLFEDWGLVVESEREVFFRGRTIDLVVSCTDSDQARLQNTIFAHFRWLNAIELKGIHDPLTMIDYNRIMTRAWALGTLKPKKESENETDDSSGKLAEFIEMNRLPSRRTVTIVCVTKPIKIINEFKTDFKSDEEGIYDYEADIFRRIICPSELALVEKNYPLLPLARGNKLAEFVSLCFREGLTNYLRLIMDIGNYTDPNVILQKILEVKQMKPQLREETWPYIDQFFQEMPEAMWKIPTFQTALVESQKMAERRGERRGEQKTLIRQLRRKFTEVPDHIVQKIESTTDLEQLDNWLDQVIAANSLSDTGFLTQ